MAETNFTKLTPEQEIALEEKRKDWLAVGLDTRPVDLEKAIEAIKLAYNLAKLKEPKHFYHVASPDAAVKLLQSDELVAILGAKKTKGEILNQMIYGSFDAYWLAFYSFFRDIIGVEDCKKLDGLFALARVAGWTNVFEDVVVFQDRPISIKFDDQDRLHCADGPALGYSDGYGIFMWHNVRVPGEWILHPDKIDAEVALTHRNAEMRRCAVEIAGWKRILENPKFSYKVIDTDPDPQIGQLLEFANLPTLGTQRFLKVQCGTGRDFVLPVPPNMETALQAQAFGWRLTEKDWAIPEVRT